MRHIAIPPAPASLNGPAAKQERADVAAFYAISQNQTSAYTGTFRAYKADDVKKALHKAFHGKCAYCESLIEATQPLDVEHFRPKAAVKIEGRLQPPGYHWLASRWENLLPACHDCNRPRKQDFPAGMPATAGKANQFPISSERKRAKTEGAESGERPLLLHPYYDDPAQHLEYTWQPTTPERGEVVARRQGARVSRIGKTSIDVYALQRAGLVRQRRERLTLLLGHLEQLVEIREEIARRNGDSFLETLFEKMVDEVEIFLSPDKPYSAMCHQVVQAFHSRVFP
jgi:uncharacterized protein (TIGR02646 family)